MLWLEEENIESETKQRDEHQEKEEIESKEDSGNVEHLTINGVEEIIKECC